jgi:hypothetical protein
MKKPHLPKPKKNLKQLSEALKLNLRRRKSTKEAEIKDKASK